MYPDADLAYLGVAVVIVVILLIMGSTHKEDEKN